MKLDPQTVIIDVSGGVVQAVLSDLPIKVILVDWDNIKEGDTVDSYYSVDKLGKLPSDTKDAIKAFVNEVQPLTARQVQRIRTEVVYALRDQHPDVPFGLFQDYVSRLPLKNAIALISGDRPALLELLGFDPKTGKFIKKGKP